MKKLLPLFLLLALASCSTKTAQVDNAGPVDVKEQPGKAYPDPGPEPYDTFSPRDLPMVGAGSTFRINEKSAKTTLVAGDYFLIESYPSLTTMRTSTDNIATYTLNKIKTQAGFESILFELPEGGGTGTPGGTDTQIQFNDSDVFGGDSGLLFNKTTNALTVSGAVSAPSYVSSGADGTHGLDITNTVPITYTPTSGRISWYGDRLREADGVDWDNYFLEAADLGILIQGYDTDLAIAAGMSAAGNSKYFGTNGGGTPGIYDLPTGSGGGVESVSTDPASPSAGYVWYNTTDHKIKVREAGGTTVFEGVYTADTPTSGPEFESIAVGLGDTGATSLSTSTSLVVPEDGLIVAGVHAYTGVTYDITGVTCGSNTLSLKKTVSIGGDEFKVQVWSLANAVAYTGTCTATFNESLPSRGIIAAAYSGVATTTPLDKSSCNVADCDELTGATVNRTAVDTATTAQADELLVAFELSWDVTHAYTAQNGYTRRTAASGVQFSLFDKTVSATGAYPGGNFATVDSADSYVSIFLTFKAL